MPRSTSERAQQDLRDRMDERTTATNHAAAEVNIPKAPALYANRISRCAAAIVLRARTREELHCFDRRLENHLATRDDGRDHEKADH